MNEMGAKACMIKFFVRNILAIVVSVAILTLIFTKVIANAKVVGDSMNTTLNDGDRVIALRRSNPQRGDIVLFKAPDGSGQFYIKRVIGVPGDSIRMRNDVLYVNDQIQPENYLGTARTDYQQQTGNHYTGDFDLFTLTKRFNVPVNQFFVMGDNRPNSTDSRVFGFVSNAAIVGVVLVRYFPLTHIQLF